MANQQKEKKKDWGYSFGLIVSRPTNFGFQISEIWVDLPSCKYISSKQIKSSHYKRPHYYFKTIHEELMLVVQHCVAHFIVRTLVLTLCHNI